MINSCLIMFMQFLKILNEVINSLRVKKLQSG